jgi:hypothetical protein
MHINLEEKKFSKYGNTKKVNMATISIIQLPLSSQQLKKPDKTKIPCLCGDLDSNIWGFSETRVWFSKPPET